MGRKEAGIPLSRILTYLALMLLSATPAAAWDVRVVGETRLAVTASAAGTIAQVSGSLRDELDRGIAHRSVEVSLQSVSGPARVDRKIFTDARGTFALSQELPPGQYTARVMFVDEPHLKGSQQVAELALVPAPVDVKVVVPALAVGKAGPIQAYGRATAADIPVQADALVYVNGKTTSTVTLDPSGRASFDVGPYLVQGKNTIEMTVPGSAYRDASKAAAEIHWEPRITLEATMEAGLERLSRGYVISGSVAGASGPLADVRVQTVFLPVTSGDVEGEGVEDTRQPVTVFTHSDEDGNFQGFASDIRLGGGSWRGVARAVPPVGPAVEVQIPELSLDANGGRGFLNILGFLVLAAGLAFLSYRGVGSIAGLWERYRSRVHKTREREQAFEVEARIVPRFLEESDARPNRNDIAGLVWDEWQRRPVTGANVTLRGDGKEVSRASDERGRFVFEGLDPGEWELSLSANGFVRGSFSLKVPHDGRFGAMRLDLVAVPLKVRRLYQAALETLRGEDPWGRLSPREVAAEIGKTLGVEVELAEGESKAEILERITAAVEQSYFSGRVFDEAFWRETRELIIRWTQPTGGRG